MIENLLKYQQVDANLREIEQKIAKCEERKKAAEAKKYLDGVTDSVNKLDDKAGELINAYEALKSESAKLEEQKEEFSKALEGIEDQTGANYLIKKVDELTSKIKKAAQTLKTLLEELTAIGNEYMVIKAKTQQQQASYKENYQKYKDFKETFNQEIENIKAQLETLKKSVEPSLMEKYQKKRENKMFPIVFEVVNNTHCGGCYTELSLSEQTKLKNGEILECSCGRLIYLKK